MIALLQKGSIVAFEGLFEQYSQKLYRFSFSYLKSESESEDVVQEVFLKIWENRPSLKTGTSFQSYLFTIAFNSIKNVKIEIPFDRPDKNYDLRGPDLPFFHNPFLCSITGIEVHPVENISFENIEITYPGRGNDGLAILPIYRLKDVPEQEAEYPEFSMFGELPAWALYVRHVSELSMKNITVKAVAPDYRPAFVFDDVDGLKLNVLDIHEDDSDKQVIFRNVRNYNKGLSPEIIKIVE